jgi:hypothetical protein
VFKLIPPGLGKTSWTKTTLHRFSGGSGGGLPAGTLRVDAAGAVYGTTYQGGTGTCLGGLPSAVIGCGTVFKLTPPGVGGTTWTRSILYSFKGPDGAGPQGGVIADAAGRLYGTASGGGTDNYGVFFRLNPPLPGRVAWTATVLHYFNILSTGKNPAYGLAVDPQGRFFGTAYYGGTGLVGTVFQLTP